MSSPYNNTFRTTYPPRVGLPQNSPSHSLWSELPEDVWVEVFSMLSGRDLAVVSQVSRRWNAITYFEDGFLWRSLYARQFPQSPLLQFESPVQSCPRLLASPSQPAQAASRLGPSESAVPAHMQTMHTVLTVDASSSNKLCAAAAPPSAPRTYLSWRQLFQRDYTRLSWKELQQQRMRQLRQDANDWLSACADRNIYRFLILTGLASFLIVNLLLLLHEQTYINGTELLVVLALWTAFCVAIIAMIRCRWVTNWTRALVYTGWLGTVACVGLATLRFQFAVHVPASLFCVAILCMGVSGLFMLISVCACLRTRLVPAAYRGPWSCLIDAS